MEQYKKNLQILFEIVVKLRCEIIKKLYCFIKSKHQKQNVLKAKKVHLTTINLVVILLGRVFSLSRLGTVPDCE